jgi:hypothetical protein
VDFFPARSVWALCAAVDAVFFLFFFFFCNTCKRESCQVSAIVNEYEVCQVVTMQGECV